MNTARDRFYLNKREGKLLGVCAGLADYVGVDALWVRLGVVALTLLGFGFAIPLYVIIGLLASRRPEPWDHRSDLADDRAYERSRRRQSRQAIRAEMSDMDRRLSSVERHYGTNVRLADEIDGLR